MDKRKRPASKNFEDRTQEDIWDAMSRQNPKNELMSSHPFFQFLRKRLYDDTTKVNEFWRRYQDIIDWKVAPATSPEDSEMWRQTAIKHLKEDLATDISYMRERGPLGRRADKIKQWYRDRTFESN